MANKILTVRLPLDEHARLVAEAAAAEMTLSEWARRIILAGHRSAPATSDGDSTSAPVASLDEVMALLSESAREGDVRAMRYLLDQLAPKKAAPAEQVHQFTLADELAARREAKRA